MPRETTARQPRAPISTDSACARRCVWTRTTACGSCNWAATSPDPRCRTNRAQLNAAGQFELKLKMPWRDGTTRLVTSPLEFMQWLVALVLRPRPHLIRLVSADFAA